MRIILTILIINLSLIVTCSQGYIVNIKEKTHYTEGRDLFISKCNSCHQLYNPNKYTVANWDLILVPMKEKAKLKAEQRDEIYNWILEVKRNSKKSVLNN